MGITPTDNNCMYPKEVFRARTPAHTHCPSCAPGAPVQEGKICNSKPMEKTMEEQLVTALVSPKQLCKRVYAIICTIWGGGGEWVDPSCLDYLQEAKLQIDLGAG